MRLFSDSPFRLVLILGVFSLLGALVTGCGGDEKQCVEDEDCPINARCIFGKCEPLNSDVGLDNNSDGTPDLGFDTSGCVPPVSGAEIRINEVHTAPTSGMDDSNCDGNASSTQDEFIEIVNTSTNDLLLTGIAVHVGGSSVFAMQGCLQAGRGLVVYSGGEAMCTDLGGTQAFVADKALGLNNSDPETVALVAEGTTLDEITVPPLGSSHASYVRVPDFTGEFDEHINVSMSTNSPGKCIDGSELLLGCMVTPPMDVLEGDMGDTPSDMPTDMPTDMPPPCDPPMATDLVLNELMYDPPDMAAGDANCDGSRSATQDEFVEIVNVSMMPVNLNGVKVHYDGSPVAEFTEDECLNPGQALVVFGGGTPMCAGLMNALVKTDGLGLANSGMHTVEVVDSTNTPFTLGTATYNGDADNQSLQRNIDLTGDMWIPFTSHPAAGMNLFTPGLCASGAEFSTGCL